MATATQRFKVGGLRVLLGVVLLLGLLALLTIYSTLSRSNLGALVYTDEQQQYLSYNSARSISQAPADFNYIAGLEAELQEGALGDVAEAPAVIGPAVFSDWENEVDATLAARYEEKNGVSVTIYDLDFTSMYSIKAPDTGASVELIFPFPGNLDTLHDVQLLVNGTEPDRVSYTTQAIVYWLTMEANKTYDIVVTYKAEGVNEFQYGLYKDRRVNHLNVNVEVTGVRGTEVVQASLPTTDTGSTLTRDTFVWDYTNLVGNQDIKLKLPQRLSFAQRVTRLQSDFRDLGAMAPFLVALFVGGLAGLLWFEGQRLPFEVYLLMGLGLALFYPLLTFLSGLLPLWLAAILAVAAVLALEVVFLILSGKWTGIALQAGWLLLIILVFLSLGMLTPVRGLLMTLGGVLLVATFMFAVARRSLRGDLEPAPAEVEVADFEPVAAEVGYEEPAAIEPEADVFQRHCPNCGNALAEGDHFCSACGYHLELLHRCKHCDYEQSLPPQVEHVYCLRCGEALT